MYLLLTVRQLCSEIKLYVCFLQMLAQVNLLCRNTSRFSTVVHDSYALLKVRRQCMSLLLFLLRMMSPGKAVRKTR